VHCFITHQYPKRRLPLFNVTRKGDNRLDIEFTGKLDSDAMRAALDDLVAKGEGIEHGRMFYRIGDFDMPTLGAIGIELSRHRPKPGLKNKRAAFTQKVCEKLW
jgi:hypothetical protein